MVKIVWQSQISLRERLIGLIGMDLTGELLIDSINISMSTSNNTISISELRQDATNLINLAISGQNHLIVMQRSKPKAVLVDYLYFQALEEAIMDLTDSQEAERAKLEPTESFDKYFEKRFGSKVK